MIVTVLSRFTHMGRGTTCRGLTYLTKKDKRNGLYRR
jgi:hypothetical protein